MEIDLAGGNIYTNSYGTLNVITQTSLAPKPNSGASTISDRTTYACPNYAGSPTCDKPTAKVDADGNETDFTYDQTTGLVLTETEPAGANGVRPQTRYTYSPITTYGLNASGALAPLGSVWRLTATSACATQSSCAGTADEVKTSISYAGSNEAQPTSTTKGAGDGSLAVTTSSTYDTAGNELTKTDGRGNVTRYRYDLARRTVGEVGPDPDGSGSLKNRATRTSYDALGRVYLVEQGTVASQSDADWANFTPLADTLTGYDLNSRKIREDRRTGGVSYAVTQWSYDIVGRLQCAAIRMNAGAFASLPASACQLGSPGPFGQDRITLYAYDAAGRLTKTTSAYGTSVQRDERTSAYDVDGQVVSETDADGNVTGSTYDGLNRLAATCYPSPSSAGTVNAADCERYAYDADGLRLTDTRRDGHVVTYAYDALKRVTSRSAGLNDGADATYAYDNLGRRTQATGDGQTLSDAYDALGRMVGETGPLGAIAMSYDADGNMTRLQWPDGTWASYLYDAADEMTDVFDAATHLAYHTYDDLGRPSAAYHANAANTVWAACIGYGYGSDLKLSGSTVYGTNCTPLQSYGYWYNAAGQLRSSTSSNAAYDWTPPSTVVARPYVVNGLNQYVSSGGVAISYDGRGNLTNDTRLGYGYDVLDRLTQVSNGAGLAYDPADRLFQTVGSSTTRFLYFGEALIGEYDASGTALARYVPGEAGELAGWYDHPGAGGYANRRYDLTDREGSVIAVTDDSGDVLGVNTYDESGNPGPANIGRFQYDGAPWIPMRRMSSSWSQVNVRSWRIAVVRWAGSISDIGVLRLQQCL